MTRLKIRLTGTGRAGGLAAFLLTAACAAAPSQSGFNDPLEPMNRGTHAVNKALDRAVVGPTAKGYGAIIPEPVRTGISNVADTLDLPGDVANNLLQARFDHAAINTLRFGLNATLGLGGLLDISTAAGLPREDTDFGETLHVWGIGEGPYLELPGLGPSNARDAVGTVVDIVFNPVGNWVQGDEKTAVGLAKLLSRLNDRVRYSGALESILYESEDSYAQARLLYLQNRRHELSRGSDSAAEDDFIDPYEDF